MKKVLLFLANGFEEVEAVTPVDYLRRAEVEVITAAVGGDRIVTGARKIPLMADVLLGDLHLQKQLDPRKWDAVLCPGGMPGASNIAASSTACNFLKDMAASGKLVSAICASPAVVLGPLGLLDGRKFTCFPEMENQVPRGIWQEDRVVIDGNIVTSRGPGTAVNWAITLIEILAGIDKAHGVMQSTLAKL